MKKVIFLFAFAILGGQSIAQNNEAEMMMSMFKIEKKALLMDFLKLNEDEATQFWPVYEMFTMDRAELSKKKIALITKYTDEYNTITPEQIDELVGESFVNRAAIEKLHKSYYKKIKKVVGAKRAAQFVQYERFVDNAINTELNNNLPLIGEMD